MSNTFGRGLESLIPKKGGDQPLPTKQEPIFYIEIEKIKSNPYKPRKNFDQDSLKALAESIRLGANLSQLTMVCAAIAIQVAIAGLTDAECNTRQMNVDAMFCNRCLGHLPPLR